MPCGGDVVGSWTVVDSCLKVSGSVTGLTFLGLGCGAAPTTGSLEVTGTWSASSDGLVVDNTHTSGDSTFDMPMECTNTPTSPLVRCPSLNDVLAPVLGAASLDCVDSESAWCGCSATFAQSGSMGLITSSPMTSGSYTTAGGVLTASDGVNHAEYSYCSFEDTLTLSLAGAGRTGTVIGSILLQKQH